MKKDESGSSMLEVLCYLSLIVVISVATFKVYQSESNKAERLRLENQIYDIIDKVHVIEFGNKTGVLKATKANLEKAGVSLKHKWGNGTDDDMEVIWADDCIVVKIQNLPQHACLYLAYQVKSECKVKGQATLTTSIAGGSCDSTNTNGMKIHANRN